MNTTRPQAQKYGLSYIVLSPADRTHLYGIIDSVQSNWGDDEQDEVARECAMAAHYEGIIAHWLGLDPVKDRRLLENTISFA